MATLTYDPTPADQPELRESEVEALRVGQEQADAEGQLLAGNFKTTEDLERAYIELRKEFSSRGSKQEESEEEEEYEEGEEEETEEDDSPETLTEDQAIQLQNMVGGEQAYNDMLIWAGQNLSKEDCDVFDSVVGKGDPNSCLFAIQALKNAYQNATGRDGQMLTGSTPAADTSNSFRSQAEVMEAMSDPRYDKDPAYRQDVFDKLDRSNIQY